MDSKTVSSVELWRVIVDELTTDLPPLDLGLIRKEVLAAEFQNISTIKILCKNVIACNHFVNPAWSLLAGRVFTWFTKKFIPNKFSEAMVMLEGFCGKKFLAFVKNYAQELNAMIVPERDYLFDIVGATTLYYTYQAKTKNLTIVETPQYMYLRNAIHHMMPDLDAIKEFYDLLSQRYFTVASPNYFNAGMKCPNTGSCFLMRMEDDTNAITETWKDAAIISKHGGGLGIDMSPIRVDNISNTGLSASFMIWLQTFQNILKAFNQGGKRKGNATIGLPFWHYAIEEFTDAKLPSTPEELSARDLFYCISYTDLFFERLYNDDYITIFTPNQTRALIDSYGSDFAQKYLIEEERYLRREISGMRIKARELAMKFMRTWMLTGGMFAFFKDTINRKSNQMNIGPVVQTNLCTEITEVTSNGDIAACNLASLNLSAFVVRGMAGPYFDYEKFEEVVKKVVVYLNRTIDRSFYFEYDGEAVIPRIKKANFANRPLGIGIQGLADAAAALDISWVGADGKATPEIIELNSRIASTLYFASIESSMELSRRDGWYPNFPGSPTSYGLFQEDLWTYDEHVRQRKVADNLSAREIANYLNARGLLDPSKYLLRSKMIKYGLRNSLLVSYMPTANTAHIIGNNESFEMFSGCIYSRKLLEGQYQIVNRHLYNDLVAIGEWTPSTVEHILKMDTLDGLEVSNDNKARFEFLKLKYKSIYDVDQRIILDLSAIRGRYVCQSQSLNIHCRDLKMNEALNILCHAHRIGVKTLYYFRTVPNKARDVVSKTITSLFERNRVKCEADCESCVL